MITLYNVYVAEQLKFSSISPQEVENYCQRLSPALGKSVAIEIEETQRMPVDHTR